jgi:glycosyltransferase 2 family protein
VMALVLLPQRDNLSESLKAIKEANPAYVSVALLAAMTTYFVAALALMSLALRPIRLMRTLVVQLASGFATKLVPAGIGGFALNARYLTRSRHSVVQASSVMALNGLLGFSGHAIILLLSLTTVRGTLDQTVSLSLSPAATLVVLAFVSAAMTIFLFVRPLQAWVRRILRDVWGIMRAYRHAPLKTLGGFLGACGVTALFTLALFFCALSLGIHLTFLQVMLVYTAGSIGTAVVPTPGGIGGAEAALAAALIAIGTDPALSVSLAVLFRLVTFWLPILPGLVFFQIALRKKYI